jgi:hypothetical protein
MLLQPLARDSLPLRPHTARFSSVSRRRSAGRPSASFLLLALSISYPKIGTRIIPSQFPSEIEPQFTTEFTTEFNMIVSHEDVIYRAHQAFWSI